MTTSEQQIRSAIAQLAAEWYIANRTAPLSDAKRGEFLAWLKSSPVHIEDMLYPPIAAGDVPGFSAGAGQQAGNQPIIRACLRNRHQIQMREFIPHLKEY